MVAAYATITFLSVAAIGFNLAPVAVKAVSANACEVGIGLATVLMIGGIGTATAGAIILYHPDLTDRAPRGMNPSDAPRGWNKTSVPSMMNRPGE